MTNQIKISIITIVFNAQETIERTINSVLNQNYSNIEYIIIDGGSTDNTVNLIKKYKNNLAYFHSKKDNGIYDAMNQGIKVATGDYIILVNADDWLEKDIVSEVTTVLAKNSSIDILHGNINYIKDNQSKLYKPKKNINRFLWHGMAYYHPTYFVNKKVYKSVSFDDKYKLLSDYKFTLDCLKESFKFFYYDKIISNYSAGGESSVFWLRIVEGHKIRVEHGYNIMLVYVSSLLRIIKTFLSYIKNDFRIKVK